MEENKFEKQVQQKMDELKIQPSDSVWEKIEKRIGKKERSNRGLFLLLLLFFGFLAGGYLLWNNRQHSIKEDNDAAKNNSKKTTNEISKKENKDRQEKTNFVHDSINQKNNAGENPSLKKNINKNSSQHYKLSTAKRIIRINSGEKSAIVLAEQQEGKKDKTSENKDVKHGMVRPVEIQSENKKISDEIKDSTLDQLNKDSLSTPPSLQKDDKDKVKDTSKQILTSSETIKHAKKNKWRPGILLSGGISGVGNNFLGLVNSPAYDYLSPLGSGSVTAPSYAPPSRTKSAFGFMAGVFAERNISVKTRLVLGLNFKSFNTSNRAGSRNDTTGFYNTSITTGAYNTYKNRYDFIEFPVTLKVQLGRGENIPLFWQGGLVLSELISSNALQFNQSSGYYYTDNSVFNKTQIGLNTSISVAFFAKQKNSLLIGPYFYYGASRLANEGLYNKKHFVFTGLHTEISFGK